MNAEDIPTYTAEDLERLSISILKEKLTPPITPPIDIEFILETVQNVTLEASMRLHKEHGVIAVIVNDLIENCHRVIVDTRIMDRPESFNFYRFTIAEEFAHLRLHGGIIDKITSIKDAIEFLTCEKYWQVDRNAKRLAAALLMPSFLVAEDARKIYPELIKVAGFGDPDAITNYVVSRLARSYQVSFNTMNYRLNEWPIRMKDRINEAIRERLDFID